MALSKHRIIYLLEAYTSGGINAAEETELMEWLSRAGEDSALRDYMQAAWQEYKEDDAYAYVDWQGMYRRILNEPAGKEDLALQGTKRGKVRRLRLAAVAAASVILIGLAAGGWLYFGPHTQQPAITAAKAIDIPAPTGTRAVLTLADGSMIVLDSSAAGTLATQGNIQIIKDAAGRIRYAGTHADAVSYNTLQVPRGSQPVTLSLADGTEVWLNAGSGLRYPTAFAGGQRKVEITGEGYFEVAHNAAMPFVVQHGDVAVQVLGTHFDVNSYDDEAAMKVTLLEGAVKVSRGAQQRLLQPGQQAVVQPADIAVTDKVNMDEVMAWKSGKFIFGEDADISSIMRQLSRWYNVEIRYSGHVTRRFWGTVPRSANIAQVLKILEATGGVRFKMEGQAIVVMPGSP